MHGWRGLPTPKSEQVIKIDDVRTFFFVLYNATREKGCV